MAFWYLARNTHLPRQAVNDRENENSIELFIVFMNIKIIRICSYEKKVSYV